MSNLSIPSHKHRGRLIALFLVLSFYLGVASPIFAGPGFRLHSSKAPIVIPPPKPPPARGYFFGYGGIISTSSYNALGGFLPPDDGGGAGIAGMPVNPIQPGPTPPDPEWYGPNTQAAGVNATAGAVGANGVGTIPMEFDLDDGFSAGFGFGIYSKLLKGSRFEIEGAYDKESVSSFTFAGFRLPADIDFTTKSLMVNWLKEVPVGTATAYFGPGVGWAETTIFGQTNTVPYNSSSSGFAWQLIAGIDIPLNERLAFFTQYRYRVLSEQRYLTAFQDFAVATVGNPSSHSLLFGLRVSF